MAAKKKEVVYVPISSNIPNAQQENLSVPSYEDRGIQYKGYAKIAVGAGQFNLKKQETRFYAYEISAGTTTVTIPRPNSSTHKFYCTNINIAWKVFPAGAYQFLTIYDGNANNSRYATWMVPNCTGVGNPTTGTNMINIDLIGSPRAFSGSIILELQAALAAGEVVFVTLTGFDEEI